MTSFTTDLAGASAQPRVGAYGLELRGLDDHRLMTPVSDGAPLLRIARNVGIVGSRAAAFADDCAEIPLLDNGWVSLRRSGEASFTLPRAVSDDELLHPWLVPAAATFNGWLGRTVLHGGILAHGGNAVAILGDKEAGKSSLLASLTAANQLSVLADDLVVYERGYVFPGPRCIDLRSPSIPQLERDLATRVVRDGTRHRVELGPCVSRARLVGVVILRWTAGPGVELRSLTPSHALSALLPHALGMPGSGREPLFDLLRVPAWSVARPPEWTTMPIVRQCLLEILSGSQRTKKRSLSPLVGYAV